MKLPISVIPRIDQISIPSDEQDAAHFLQMHLLFLASISQSFSANLALFEFSKNEPPTNPQRQWGLIAARDGAIQIYNFGCCLQSINSLLASCSTVEKAVDVSKLRDASTQFRDAFPRYEAVRHVVGHAVEFVASMAKFKAHASRGYKSPQVQIPGVLFSGGDIEGSSFIATYKGKVVSYDLTVTTRDVLATTSETVITAFPHQKLGDIR